MKATDLMIGDWVKVHFGEPNDETIGSDVYGQVSELYDNGRIEVAFIGSHSVLWNIETERGDEILPIPLTQEIFEKNGFEKKEDDFGQELYSLLLGEWVITYMSIYGCPYLTIEDVLDYERGHSVLNLKDSIYNVHELQHALKLCKIENEIVL